MFARYSAFVRNGISLLGTGIATAAAVLFVVLVLLDFAGYLANPYLGLLLFVGVPTVFVGGLLLIPLGVWRESRLRRRDPSRPVADWPVLDLRNARTRTITILVFVLTVINLVIISVATYGGVHYMETTEFCGQVCHTTMEPEFVAHHNNPHAKVPCVDCHVGPGVDALIESKLAGTRQLWKVLRNDIPMPVPPPTGNRRTKPATCAQCHWPEKFHGDKVRVIREFADDEANTESKTTLVLHVGGGNARLGSGTGIHWHMNVDNVVEFAADDAKKETIPYVRVTDRSGRTREFLVDGAVAPGGAAAPLHRMDCMDCHNRPAHTLAPTAERAVNQAMAEGRIPRSLPFVHREAVAALKGTYASRDAATAGIARALSGFYMDKTSDRAAVGQAIAGAQDTWSRNVFPTMRVSWGTYPNHLGHLDAPGCFRCHDDNHKAKDGTVIRQDCELCHAMPSE